MQLMDNIKMDLGEIGWGDMDWIDLAQEGPVDSSCECDNEPSDSINAGKFLSGCTYDGLSISADLDVVSLVCCELNLNRDTVQYFRASHCQGLK
jgi:hypothetical protein